MKRLVITIDASRDLSEISDYFLEQSIDAGDRFVEGFAKKCQYLAEFPYLGRSYDRLAPGLRGIPLMDYIIFYQIVGEGIEILRVISGYRNLQTVFNQN
ncbi:type II toxin-antitoxin system RelE/ParE family toxin [Tychonema sp. LEGE 07199]|uniref:type II toxin-antitoxin system RelE/ParE family toxin n=1 Tax=unclassified Tychonema TaxID=2642144 RepID=UPI001880BF97|nr:MULTISPECIES: type II toxin-antitoxin system RelE/ParE family toxin [unclassified Tychonema]MBE9123735.1 type II toxin-antitoxin system RelE/ParE family toxin [Tychonema sp. LEGE 07199]MBE9135116.1 type II toxin-antitoxin system RelE/ParE family toxin [Tychonema sp. LEGE 07196]